MIPGSGNNLEDNEDERLNNNDKKRKKKLKKYEADDTWELEDEEWFT